MQKISKDTRASVRSDSDSLDEQDSGSLALPGRSSSVPSDHTDSLSKRRSRSQSIGPRSKRRRLNSTINEGYLEILNEVIEEAVDRNVRRGSQPSLALWHETSAWNTKQQDNSEKRNRTLLHGVSTTSAFELLKLRHDLDDTSKKYQISNQRDRLPHTSEIPAAADVTHACCHALEEAADKIQAMRFEDETRWEETRHGDFWLLEATKLAKLDTMADMNHDGSSRFEEGDTNEYKCKIQKELMLANNLLNLSTFLDLSKNIFMNTPITADSNQPPTFLLQNNDGPSMFATSFTDLHALTVSVTKRLIAATLFQADSRLRATNADMSQARRLHIKQQDVLTAVDVLGMPRDSLDYWIGLPRRLGLEIYEKKKDRRLRRIAPDNPLPYDFVERILEGDTDVHAGGLPFVTAEPAIPGDNPSSILKDDDDPIESSSSLSDLMSDSEGEYLSEDEYLELVDRQASLKEEERLWKALGRPDCFNADTLPLETSSVAGKKRKIDKEPSDWRDYCGYMSPWENYGRSIVQMDRLKAGLKSRRDVKRRGRSVSRHSRERSEVKELASSGNSSSETSDADSDDRDSSARRSVAPEQDIAVRKHPALSEREVGSFQTSGTLQSVEYDEGQNLDELVIHSPRRRSRRSSSRYSRSSPPVYAFEPGEGIPRLEDLPSDSEDEYKL